MVRVHSSSFAAGSDGVVVVHVRADGRTVEDPATLFTGRKLTQVLAASAATSAPRYVTAAFWPGTERLVIEVEGIQDSTTADTLEADISISLALRSSEVLLPSQVPGLLLHLDALRGVDTTPALAVKTWADQSGQGNDFVAATSAQRPTLIPVDPDFDGYPSIRGGGAATFTKLHNTSFPTSGSGRSGLVLAVADADPPASVDDAGLWRFGDGTKPAIPAVDGVIKESFGSSARFLTADPTASMASPFVYAVTAQANDWANYLNGGPALGVETTVTLATPTTVNIGAGNTSSSSWLGQIVEVVVFDRKLETSELDGLGRYLAAKGRVHWTGV